MFPSAILLLQNLLSTTIEHRLPSANSVLKIFKIYHNYKAPAEIYHQLPKSTGWAYTPLTLQFGLNKVKFEINIKINTE